MAVNLGFLCQVIIFLFYFCTFFFSGMATTVPWKHVPVQFQFLCMDKDICLAKICLTQWIFLCQYTYQRLSTTLVFNHTVVFSLSLNNKVTTLFMHQNYNCKSIYLFNNCFIYNVRAAQ